MVSSCSNGGVNNINRERDGVSLSLFPSEVFPLSANVRRAHASRQNQEHSFDTNRVMPAQNGFLRVNHFPSACTVLAISFQNNDAPGGHKGTTSKRNSIIER